MRTILLGWVLTCAAGSAVCAEPVATNEPKEMSTAQVEQIAGDVFTLNYWSMLPPALMKRCETEYPDKMLLNARVGYTAWLERYVDMAGRVEASRGLFSSMLAKAQQQTQADYEERTRKMIDEKVVQGLFREFSATETEALCVDLDLSLTRMLSNNFTRDRLLPALDNLESLRSQLQK